MFIYHYEFIYQMELSLKDEVCFSYELQRVILLWEIVKTSLSTYSIWDKDLIDLCITFKTATDIW